jgi:tRNA U55 pseudouridine synthase TruB
MGEQLGCGAHLKTLRRTACGHLTIEQAMTPDELERRCATAPPPLLSLSDALGHLQAVHWPSRLISRLRLGQQELLAQIGQPQAGARLARLLDPRGELAALVEWVEDLPAGRWRLLRVFQE